MTDVWPGQRVTQTPAAPAAAPRAAASRPAQSFPGDPEQTILGLVPGARITSRERTPERNRAVGGSPNSYHLRGQAFDIVPPQGTSMAQLESQLRQAGLPFAELLNEGDHVHVAWNGSRQPSPEQQSPTQDAQWPGQPASQQELAQRDAARRYEGRGSQNPLVGAQRLLEMPWLARQPRYVDPNEGSRVGPDGVLEVDISLPSVVDRGNGTFEIYDPDSSAYYPATAEEADRARGRFAQNNDDRIARVQREQNPQYQAEYAAALARSENVPALLENLTQGASLGAVPLIEGVLGWLDPNVEGIDRGLASQAARDASRDRQARLMREDPLGTVGAQLVGGLATPGLNVAGNYIAGAQGAGRLARAAQVGGAYGAASGFISGTGNVGERLDDAAIGGLTGAGVGAVGQGALDRVIRPSAANAAARGPSNARLLSREGVDLTPGQMMAEVPIVGGMARSLEEGASSIPFVGAPIAQARQQSVETFNRAAVNRALAPLEEKLPRNVRAGYQAVEYAQDRLGQAYDDVLPRVTATPDQVFYDDIGQLLVRSADELPQDKLDQLVRLVDNRVFRNRQGSTDPISGTEFKQIESELGALSREYARSNDPSYSALGRVLDDTRQVVRDLIARQNPDEAARIARINEGYANLVRVEGAAASSATMGTDGVFSPTQLSMAVSRGGGRRQLARGDALMQDLASAGRDIIPSRVGDSGTATRGAITGLVGAAATGVPIANTVAIPVIATSVLYSKPAQALLNTIYRATDSGAASSALEELARFAQRNPALLPYYEEAARHALSLAQPRSQANPQAPQSQPLAMQGQ